MSDIYVQAQLCVRYRIHTIWTGADLVRLACWCEPAIAGMVVLCMHSAQLFIFTLILPSLYPLTHFCLPLSPTACLCWLLPTLTVISLEKDIFSGGFQWNLDSPPPAEPKLTLETLLQWCFALQHLKNAKYRSSQNNYVNRNVWLWHCMNYTGKKRTNKPKNCLVFQHKYKFTGETSESLFSESMKVYFDLLIYWEIVF